MRGLIVWIIFSALMLQISLASNVDGDLSMLTMDTEAFGITNTSVIRAKPTSTMKHEKSVDSVTNEKNKTLLKATASERLKTEDEYIEIKRRREMNSSSIQGKAQERKKRLEQVFKGTSILFCL